MTSLERQRGRDRYRKSFPDAPQRPKRASLGHSGDRTPLRDSVAFKKNLGSEKLTVILPVVYDEMLFQIRVRCELFLANKAFVHFYAEMSELVALQISLGGADFPAIVTRPRLTRRLQKANAFNIKSLYECSERQENSALPRFRSRSASH